MIDFNTTVKLKIYQTIANTTQVPTAVEIASALNSPLSDVKAAFQHLNQKRLLVFEPGTTTRIRMAPPFSGIPTPFLVNVDNKSYFANCVWDALGVAAALRRNTEVITSCGYSGEPMTIKVRQGKPEPLECVIHFAVPAAKWWENIIFT
jgi:hypothetical protein